MITVNFLQILSLFKKYWREILIIVLSVIVVGKMRIDHNRIEKTYKTTQEELQKQITELNRIHVHEMKEKEKAIKLYKETLVNIEKDYEEQKKKNKELSTQRKTKLEKQFTRDKDQLAHEINKTFGIKYIP
tara:strand:+ start:4975 stop:5367 length:393 start_codon:yes stop_codon:yes gene_type:complete